MFSPWCLLSDHDLTTGGTHGTGGQTDTAPPHYGSVSKVDIDGNNALQIKVIGVIISTFETLPTIDTRPACLHTDAIHLSKSTEDSTHFVAILRQRGLVLTLP